METERDVDPELLDQLRAFAALDNPVRLRAFLLVRDRPSIPFNDIASALGLETGLAAYHVAVLKAADLLDVSYARSGRTTSSYRLSGRGEAIERMLFAGRVRVPAVAPRGRRPARLRKTSRTAHGP
jgi:DNA-binding transcriptional ArsR family regulator